MARPNTDLNPVATDPQTGYNTYELRDPSGNVRKVDLWAASSFVEKQRGRFSVDPGIVTNIDRRMRLLYDRYQGRELDPMFAMDMVASNLSDEEMVRLYDQRFAFFDRSEGGGRGLLDALKHPIRSVKETFGMIGGAVERIIPGDSAVEKKYAHPLRTINDTLNMAYDASMNNLARAITHDKDMTWNALLATGAMVASENVLAAATFGKVGDTGIQRLREKYGYNPDTRTFRDPKTGEQMNPATWVFSDSAPKWVQAQAFGAYFIDPFMAMAALRTARMGARAVRGVGEAADIERFAGARAFMQAKREEQSIWGSFKSMREAQRSKSVESFAGRKLGWWGTTVEDVDRLSKGDLKWGDYLKGVNLREIAATKWFPSLDAVPSIMRDFGFEPKTWRYFQEAALSGSADHLRLLRPDMPGWMLQRQSDIVREGKQLGKATKEIAEDLRQDFLRSYDPDHFAQFEADATAAEHKWTNAKEELDGLEESFYDPLGGEFNEWPLSEQERIRALQENPDGADRLREAVSRERQFRQDMVAAQKAARGTLANVIDTVPRHTLSAGFRRWMEHATGVEYVGEMGTSESILDRIAHKGARSLKGVMAYNPHRAVEVTDDFSHQQFRRLLDEVEMDVGSWIPGDSARYYEKYLRSADDGEKFSLMENLSNDVYSRLGFSKPQIERIKQEYRQFWGEISEQLSVTSPRNLTIMDPHLIRRLAKLGDKALEPNAVKDILEKALRNWKKLAITRPAWAFRVVGLSEQPRLAMAGAPNLVTHPLIWLATAQIPGVAKAAQSVLAARLAVPGWKSRLTLNYGAVEGILSGSDLGVSLGRADRAAAKARLSRSLGTLGFNGQPTTTRLFHRADLLTNADRTAYTRGWAEILNQRVTSDELHINFLGGMNTTEAKSWANSEAAAAWRAKHSLVSGTPELARTITKEKKFFDDWTRGDQDIIAHLRSGKKFHWKDLSDIEPPSSLPLDVFTDRLDRPGLAMSRSNMQKVLQPIYDNMSSNPSFWGSRFPAYRIKVAEKANQYLGIYSGRGLQRAVATPAEAFTTKAALATREGRRMAESLLLEEEHALLRRYVGTAEDAPEVRASLLDSAQHNVEHREAVQAVLEDLGVPEEAIIYRGAPKGTKVPDAGNATLRRETAEGYAGEGGTVTELRIKRDDIITFGAGPKYEVLFWSRDAHPVGARGIENPTESLKRIVSFAEGKPVQLSALERRIAEWSHQSAAAATRQVLYDLNESSRMADMARFVAPFGNAWQEEITRWASLMYQRPKVPYGIMTAWRHKEDLPFSYRDARSGDDMFVVPWGQNIVRAATGRFNPITGAPTGINLPLVGRWKNLNIISGSNWLPGAGPFLTIPAKVLARTPGGIGHVFQGLQAAIDPYGAGKPLSTTDFFPTPFLRAGKQLEDDPSQDAALAHAVVVHTMNRTNGKITPEDEVLMEDQLRALKVVNFATSITVGSGIKIGLAPKLREMVDYMKWAQRSFGFAAQNIFLDRYGDEAAAYMTNLTRSTTGEPPTKEAEDMLLSPENARWRKSKAFWSLMAENARGEWDAVASAKQVRRNDREARGIHELTAASYTIAGWYRYGIEKQKYVAALTAAGLTTRSQGEIADAFKQIFEKKRQSIFDAYPGFQAEFEKVDYNAWRQNMRDLYELSRSPVAAGLEGTKGAQAYFQELDKLGEVMRAADISSLGSKDAEPLSRVFYQRLDMLFRKYPDFRLVYTRLGLDAFDGREGDFPSQLQER